MSNIIGSIIGVAFGAYILFIVIMGFYSIFFKSDLSQKNITLCKKYDSSDRAKCVEDTISDIKNDWIKNCAVSNIDKKKDISDKMKNINNQTLSLVDIETIDGLVKECIFYKDQNNTSDWYPIFSYFMSSLVWSFIWNYLSNSIYSNISDYNSFLDKTKKSSNSTYSSFGSYWWYSSNSQNSSTNSNSSKSTNESLSKTKSQYDSSTWNISQMKNASESTSNYKLWDTGKSWTNSTSRKSSSSRSSSSKSSRSSSG